MMCMDGDGRPSLAIAVLAPTGQLSPAEQFARLRAATRPTTEAMTIHIGDSSFVDLGEGRLACVVGGARLWRLHCLAAGRVAFAQCDFIGACRAGSRDPESPSLFREELGRLRPHRNFEGYVERYRGTCASEHHGGGSRGFAAICERGGFARCSGCKGRRLQHVVSSLRLSLLRCA